MNIQQKPHCQFYIVTKELQPLEVISLAPEKLQNMLIETAKLGAEQAIEDMVTYHFKQCL